MTTFDVPHQADQYDARPDFAFGTQGDFASLVRYIIIPSPTGCGRRDGSARVTKLADINSEDRANLRRQWFGSVREMADIDYQRRTWLSPPDNNPHWSYIEFCSSYPDADQLKFAQDRRHLNAEEFELLIALGDAINSHKAKDDYDNRAILEDPSWRAVVSKAEAIRQRLLALTVDAVERSYLSGKLGTA
jgi:hypothetical protein